jgi:hypothetical protein
MAKNAVQSEESAQSLATQEFRAELAGRFNSKVVQKGLRQIFEALNNASPSDVPSMTVTYGDTRVEAYKSMSQYFHVTLKKPGAEIDFVGNWPEKDIDTVGSYDGDEKKIKTMVKEVTQNFPLMVSLG